MNALAASSTVLCPPPPLISGHWLYNGYALSWASSDVHSVTLADEYGAYCLKANERRLLSHAPVRMDAFWKLDAATGVATLSLAMQARGHVAYEVVLVEWDGQPLPSGPATSEEELPHLELLPMEREVVCGSWLLGDLRLCWHVYNRDCVAVFSRGQGTVLVPGTEWTPLGTPYPTQLRLEDAPTAQASSLAVTLTPRPGLRFTTYLTGWSTEGGEARPWWPHAGSTPLNACACER
jgi:hypothetical protein